MQEGDSVRSDALIPAGIFASSRLLVFFLAYTCRFLTDREFLEILGLFNWDGGWYVSVITRGYEQSVPGPGIESTIAFFPGFPLVAKGVSVVTGLSPLASGILVSNLAGTGAAVALWYLIKGIADQESATRTVALWSFFPGAFVLSAMYTESLFALFAIGCLWALLKKRWLIAGVCAAGAGAVRPNGLVLFGCCVWGAWVAIRRSRDWRSVIAVLIAPIGALGYFLFLYERTGDFMGWFRAEQNGWGVRMDFGEFTWRALNDFLGGPFTDFERLVFAMSVFFVVGAGVLMVRWKPPAVLTIYSGGLVASTLLGTNFAMTPRLLLIAFPTVAAYVLNLQKSSFYIALGVSAGTMAALQIFVAGSRLFTP